MRKDENKLLKFQSSKLGSFIIASLLFISFIFIIVPLKVSAQSNELNEMNMASA